MSNRALRADDIRVFSDAASAFFRTATGAQAQVRTAYLLEPRAAQAREDFIGVIELGGRFRGHVSFCASRGMLSHILLLLGEKDYSDASHCDIVGEIANQMTGQARRHYGEALDIHPPRVLMRDEAPLPPILAAQPFVVPLAWDRYEAQLVVAMSGA